MLGPRISPPRWRCSPGQVTTGLAGRPLVSGAQQLSFKALFAISLVGGAVGGTLVHGYANLLIILRFTKLPEFAKLLKILPSGCIRATRSPEAPFLHFAGSVWAYPGHTLRVHPGSFAGLT